MGNVDLIASYWTIAGKLNFAERNGPRRQPDRLSATRESR